MTSSASVLLSLRSLGTEASDTTILSSSLSCHAAPSSSSPSSSTAGTGCRSVDAPTSVKNKSASARPPYVCSSPEAAAPSSAESSSSSPVSNPASPALNPMLSPNTALSNSSSAASLSSSLMSISSCPAAASYCSMSDMSLAESSCTGADFLAGAAAFAFTPFWRLSFLFFVRAMVFTVIVLRSRNVHVKNLQPPNSDIGALQNSTDLIDKLQVLPCVGETKKKEE